MSSLIYFLERIEQSSESLQCHEFDPPGIFTNAIVKKPDIMKLLKDPSIDENSLYKISKIGNREPKHEFKPERIDGKTMYIDQSFNEYADYDNKDKRTAVILPNLTNEKNNLELNSSPTSIKRLRDVNIVHTDDLGEMSNMIIDLIEKYPSLVNDYESILSKVLNYKEEHTLIMAEIAQLEQDIQGQRQQLNFLNINYSDLNSPTKSGSESNMELSLDSQEDQELDLDELIRMEEEEIQQLEERLDNRQN